MESAGKVWIEECYLLSKDVNLPHVALYCFEKDMAEQSVP